MNFTFIWYKTILHFCVVVLLLIFPGCIKKNQSVLVTNTESEARYYDIPIIGDAQPLFETTDTGLTVFYDTDTPVNDIINFYIAEMECFGWQLVWQFNDKESLLFFEKPSRWLSVSVRPSKKANTVAIISGMK